MCTPGRRNGTATATSVSTSTGRRASQQQPTADRLISQATAVLVEDLARSGQSLVDLGEHPLKDIPDPVRLYRVRDPGFPDNTAQPRSQGSAGNLSEPRVGFVGHLEELAELRDLVTDGARLVTLTGPGGTGKTSLAVAAARDLGGRFPEGVLSSTWRPSPWATRCGVPSPTSSPYPPTDKSRLGSSTTSPAAAYYSCWTTSSRSTTPTRWSSPCPSTPARHRPRHFPAPPARAGRVRLRRHAPTERRRGSDVRRAREPVRRGSRPPPPWPRTGSPRRVQQRSGRSVIDRDRGN